MLKAPGPLLLHHLDVSLADLAVRHLPTLYQAASSGAPVQLILPSPSSNTNNEHSTTQQPVLAPASSTPSGGYHQQQVLGSSSPPSPQPSLLPWPQHQRQWWLLTAPLMHNQHLHQLQQHRGIKSKVQVDYRAMKIPLVDQYTGDPKNYIQLLLALKQAPNVGRLKHLVDSHSARFDAPHVSAALTRLPKVARFRQAELMQEAISATSTHISPSDPAAAFKTGGLTRTLPVPGAQARRALQVVGAGHVVVKEGVAWLCLPAGAALHNTKKCDVAECYTTTDV
ncbi:hypothetical protein DUNSADRAFT_5120 [Dunaliella salina]|uniref:Uncharacterized protein n=1 Tax=Dunaliella salina TaxID=3046 RepID=A0ABQ7H7C3_DUNSA|nr:hypothetical protein DUNSADRAFT_5120 [Dunaliella salina]|eukprot:KAF5842748.1 hypothetical protein DUNSADRAFT_5120 [Dunaliella salina]